MARYLYGWQYESRAGEGKIMSKDKLWVKLPVIPKYVVEYIKWFAQNEFDNNIENDVDFIVSLVQIPHEFLGREELEGWLNISGNAHKLIDAYKRGYEVEEEPLYYALIKGHELMTDECDKYWNLSTSDGAVFPSDRFSRDSRFLTKMSKEDWREYGINDSNADFVKAV